VDDVVNKLIDKLTLRAHADKKAESLSGGNKRKLSLGIASLVPQGGVLLIDEASSGLDPLARRRMWDLIEDLASRRSAIVTTHSMEEAGIAFAIWTTLNPSITLLTFDEIIMLFAEALCSRVGIMAHGQFIALGPVQHLKTKFLDGYSISLSCRADTPEHVIDFTVSDILNETIPGSKLTERHGRFLTFEIPRMSDLGLGTCFKSLEGLKESESSPIESYSLSQCSLEQVFIKLVKEANEREFGWAEEEAEMPVDDKESKV
jgi:ATP-binding cassette subfamily A (ABC1) protein 3